MSSELVSNRTSYGASEECDASVLSSAAVSSSRLVGLYTFSYNDVKFKKLMRASPHFHTFLLVQRGPHSRVPGQFVAGQFVADNSSQDNSSRTTRCGQFVADNSSQNIKLIL